MLCTLFQYVQAQRLAYCPEALYGSVPPNLPLEATAPDGFATIDGQYLVIDESYPRFYTTYATVYAMNGNQYCTQTKVVELGYEFYLPSSLKEQVRSGNAYTAYLIDSLGQGWVPIRDGDNRITGYYSVPAADTDEYFVKVLYNRFVSNKNRLYEADSSYQTLHFNKGIVLNELEELYRNWFVLEDSLVVKFSDTASNGNLYPMDTLLVANGPVVHVDRHFSRLATNLLVLELQENQWKTVLQLDTTTHSGFGIKRFNSKYVLLQHADSEEWRNIDFNGMVRELSSSPLKAARQVPDSLFQDKNGKFCILAGGHVHKLRYPMDEYYRNFGPIPSPIITSLNDRFFAVLDDTIFTKKDSLENWSYWAKVPSGISQITYNSAGNLILIGASAYYKIDTGTKVIDTTVYPCGKPSYLRFIERQGLVLECDSGAYLHDSTHKWNVLSGIKGLKNLAFSSSLVLAVDQDGFKFANVDALIFSSLSTLNGLGVAGFKPKKLIEPKLVNMAGTRNMFFLFSESEYNNVLVTVHDTNRTLELQSSLILWRKEKRVFLENHLDWTTGFLPFKTLHVAHNDESLTLLSDIGMVRFDCMGSLSPNPKQEISIYPNPASNVISFNKEYSYAIYDVQGRKVLSGSGQQAKVEFLPSGLYLVKLLDERTKAYAKFIKE